MSILDDFDLAKVEAQSIIDLIEEWDKQPIRAAADVIEEINTCIQCIQIHLRIDNN